MDVLKTFPNDFFDCIITSPPYWSLRSYGEETKVEWEGGVVLDPFMGSGTVAYVAKQMRRNYVGIELNQEYIDIAMKRIKHVQMEMF